MKWMKTYMQMGNTFELLYNAFVLHCEKDHVKGHLKIMSKVTYKAIWDGLGELLANVQ